MDVKPLRLLHEMCEGRGPGVTAVRRLTFAQQVQLLDELVEAAGVQQQQHAVQGLPNMLRWRY